MGGTPQHPKPPSVTKFVGLMIGLGLFVAFLALHNTDDAGPSAKSTSSSYASSESSTASYGASTPTAATSSADDAFIAAITADGISLNSHEAILQGRAVCLFLGPGNGGSIWDAIQQTREMRGWDTVSATHFVDRSIQNYCPERAPG